MSKRRPGTVCVWAWGGLGTAGSVLVALAGTRLAAHDVITWWLHPDLTHGVADAMLYAGLAAICAAWLGVGASLSRVTHRQLWLLGALWTLPVLLGPPIFSRDVYSYLAQGELLHLGLDPYRDPPVVLAHHGQGQLLAAVSPFWRHTTAPYGPLFLGLVSPIAAFAGSHLVLAALLVKLIDLVGVVLLAIFVPILAARLGGDPKRALWLVAMSPLILLQIVGAGHNDALMAGLMVAGVTLALKDRPLLAVAVCALAAAIKLPAALAIAFIAVSAARAQPTSAAGGALLAKAVLTAIGVLALVSVATTLGLHWVTTGVFSTPQKVRLAITPATSIGYTFASLLHDLGIATDSRSVESAFGALAGAITVVLAAVLLWRSRRGTGLVRDLAVVLLAAAVGGPAAWPWYLIWGLALLAACPGPQRSRAFAIAATAPVFLISASGIALPPRPYSPLVVAVYAVIAALAWQTWRRNRGALPRLERHPGRPSPEPTT
jgi:alpha-1,6-mannosyltransferase